MKDIEPTEIRSTSNPTIRRLVRLRDNRFRRQCERVLVDGWRETARAMDAGLSACGVFATRDTIKSITEGSAAGNELESARQVVRTARDSGVLQTVTSSILERIAYGQSTRGVVAEFHQPARSLASLELPNNPFLLVLDQIEKPGNVGAVFRCAVAAGVDAVILTGTGADLFNPNAIRSSLGTVFCLPSAVATTEQTQSFLVDRGIRVLAARVDSADPLWSCDLTGPLAVVLGSESHGLGDCWRILGDTPIVGVRIPMADVDSLNVSVSAAVIAYEAMRVRN